ncbi:MAG TPA: hypothetical protein VH280_13780 [Verrucomicrobiae bacterium]|jgi:hypothetical protein|nr:hypothetical protein [Verrucomicrobiae bacterium]
MLRRIILIVAIVGGLAAVGVNIGVVRPKIIALQADRDSQRSQKEQFHTQLTDTQKTLKITQATLDQTKADLATAKTENSDLNKKLVAANTQIADVTAKLTKTTQQLNDTQDQLAAYKGTGLTPPEIVALDKELKASQTALAVANDEKALLAQEVKKLQNQLALIVTPGYEVPLPPSLKGTVMAVDPKWNFVVLNIGANQGVLQSGEMLVSRDGRLVAKVIISSVQKDRCIANMVPGWQLGDIIEGDQVIPAHPAS